jgi:hypothetical protein
MWHDLPGGARQRAWFLLMARIDRVLLVPCWRTCQRNSNCDIMANGAELQFVARATETLKLRLKRVESFELSTAVRQGLKLN